MVFLVVLGFLLLLDCNVLLLFRFFGIGDYYFVYAFGWVFVGWLGGLEGWVMFVIVLR